MSSEDVARLLNPGTVAVVGGREAEVVIQQALAMGYRGEIWAVNPNRSELAGVPCFSAVADLPGTPDVAFVAVNRQASVEVVAQLADLGAGTAICYASGFSEVGAAGVKLQEKLLAAAGEMMLLGPNCYGFVNAVDRVALWPDNHGCRPVGSGAALISHSGNVGINLTFQDRNLPVTHLITLGNQAGITTEACIEALVRDERVKAIGLFIEGVVDSVRFGQAVAEAQRRGVPVVALRTARSDRGAEIALTHTASLAGRDEAFGALFDRYGVYEVDTLPALLEALKMICVLGSLEDNTIVSMSSSGGEASLTADLARAYEIEFPDFEPAHAERVRAALSGLEQITNPLDYHTFIWNDRARMTELFTSVLDGPFAAAMLILDFPHGEGSDDSAWWLAVESLVAAHEATGTKTAVVATLPECLPSPVRTYLANTGIAPMQGLTEALAAFEAAAWAGSHSKSLPILAHAPAAAYETAVAIDEDVAKQRLRDWGVPVPSGEAVDSATVEVAAERVGYPVTLKALGADHKTEAGLVAVGLADGSSLALARDTMKAGRFLVEETVQENVLELLVGLRREPPVGWLLTVGAGGVNAELDRDMRHLLAPASPAEIEDALRQLRLGARLDGFRHAPAVDLPAAIEAIRRLVEGALKTPNLIEVEINPLVVGSPGRGASAVDALFVEER